MVCDAQSRSFKVWKIPKVGGIEEAEVHGVKEEEVSGVKEEVSGIKEEETHEIEKDKIEGKGAQKEMRVYLMHGKCKNGCMGDKAAICKISFLML